MFTVEAFRRFYVPNFLPVYEYIEGPDDTSDGYSMEGDRTD